MAKKKGGKSSDININDLNDINKFIGKFLEEANRQFLAHGALNEPVVFGFNVKIGEGGMPTIEKFGNVEVKKEQITLSENREPLVDVIKRDSEITVIAEMPGIEEKDIHISLEDKTLNISAASRERSYHKSIPLHDIVDTKNYKYKYNNGVLEITLRKSG